MFHMKQNTDYLLHLFIYNINTCGCYITFVKRGLDSNEQYFQTQNSSTWKNGWT